MQVTFKDPIGPSASQALMEWFRLHAESVTGRMGYAAGYKTYSGLPELEEYAIYHPKTIEKQEQQNNFYEKI